MPYIGRELERGTYLKLDDISSSFDGNKTIFNLTKGGDPFFPGSPQSIIVSLNGTILEPVTEYGIDSSKIVFGTAPTAGHAFFSITLGLPFGVFDNGSIEDGSLTGFKLSNPFNYDGGLLYLNSITDRVGIRTENPTHDLDVHGDVRIVGILTVGTSSLVLDGSNNKIQVGTALTLSHNDGAQIGKSHLHSTGYDLKTGAKIKLGDSGNLELFYSADGSFITHAASSAKLFINTNSSAGIEINKGVTENMAKFIPDGAVELYHGMGSGAGAQKKFNTSTTGATVTGKLVVTGDLDVQGTTTTLDTTLTEVDKLEVGANNTTVGVAITQSGTGDALTIDDGTSRVFTVQDGGNVGIGTNDPSALLHLYGSSPKLYFTDTDTNVLSQIDTDSSGGNFAINVDVNNNEGSDANFMVRFNQTHPVSAAKFLVNQTGKVGIGTGSPSTKLHVYNGTPSDTGGILVSNVNYAANQDKPYLIVGTKGWTGATTNWNTFGFQHKIKSDHDGTPRLTIDSLSGELFTLKNNGSLGLGVTNPQGRLHIPDSRTIRLGNDSDARLTHSGSHFIFNNYTGNTYLRINGTEEGIVIKANDQVQLFYDDNLRFNTTADGVKVTGPNSGTGVGIGTTADHDPLILASFNNGVSNVSQFRILSKRDTNGTDWTTSYTRLQQRIDVTDQAYIQFNGSDNTYGMEFGTHGDEKFAKFERNGAVKLYHDNGQRFNTTAQGINVTTVGDVPQVAIAQTTTTAYSVNGTVSFVNANNTTAQIQGRTGSASTTGDIIFLCNTVGDESFAILEDGKVRVPDRGSLVVGQGNDLTLKHDTNSSITNITGQLAIENTAGNLSIKASNSTGDIIMRAGGGSSSENAIVAVHHGEVVLSFNGSTRLTTTNTGVDITDNLKVAGITTFSGDINVDGEFVSGKTLVLNSNASDPVIKIQGGGPNFIRFASDASGTVDSDSIDLVYRTTPNQLVFERASDAVDLLSVDADNGLVAITNNLNVTGNLDVDGQTDLDDLAVAGVSTFSADVNVGDGSAQTRILIKKADEANDAADHIQFYNGTTRTGEIGSLDNSWLRINQTTNKPIYTPRYIRADAGFFVDNTSKGINGSGNFIGGTIAGASDYDTLLRSDTNDTMNGELTVGGSAVSANEGGQINLTLAPNSSLNGNLVIDQYIDQLRFFEGSGSSARGATIIFTHLTGNTDNEIFSSGLTGVGYTVTHLRSFGIPNGVVAISTSNSNHTPLTVTNSGGFSANTIITKFVGNSDGLDVRNINSGDYQIRIQNVNTGISFYNGGNGLQFLYDGSRKLSVIDGGLSVNDELTFEKDDEGVTTYDGGRFYKKNGGGIAIRQSSGNQTPIIENNAGTLQGTILHTGSSVEVTGNLKFSGDGLQLSDHYFQGYYDTANRQNYIHLYPVATSDRGTSASTTDIRAWTGSTFKVLQIKGDADPTWDGNKIIHAGNASTDLTQFLRSDVSDTAAGKITLTNSNAYPLTIDTTNNAKILLAGSSNPYIRFREGSTDKAYIQFHSTNGFQLVNEETSEQLRIQNGDDGLKFVHGGTVSTVLHTGNIGSNPVNQIVLGNDSDGTTARRLVFASADTGTVTIQADTTSGATYTPSTGRIGCQQIEVGDIIGNTTIDGNFLFATGHVAQMHNTATRDKYRVWNASDYAIGMDDSMSFGGLNDYAMTFQMNNDNDRGWVFLDSSHGDAQGAMSLTTNGKMCIADSLRLGYGQSDTTTPGANSTLDVSGQIISNTHIRAGHGSGGVALTVNDGYGNANIAFNHFSGKPDSTDSTQSAGRIECGVDNATAQMNFELWDNTTFDTATGNANVNGGAGVSGIQLSLTTSQARINPRCLFSNEIQFVGSNPELEFNSGGPRFRVPAANTLTFHSGGGLGSANEERMRIGSDGVITMYNDLLVNAPSTNNYTRLHGGSMELNREDNDAFIDFKTTFNEDFDCRIQKSSNALVFYTGGNNSTQLTLNLKGNGQVEIPNGKFTVKSSIDFYGELNYTGASSSATKYMDVGFEGGTQKFHMRRIDYDDSGHATFFTCSQSLVMSGDFNDTSDEKLKKNIATISDGAIEDIKKLRPVTFDWIDDTRNNNVSGFVAQEVKEVLPNLIDGTEYDPTLNDPEKGTKGGIKSEGYSINSIGVTAHLTKALQEAIAKIETLEAEVTALKAKVG